MNKVMNVYTFIENVILKLYVLRLVWGPKYNIIDSQVGVLLLGPCFGVFICQHAIKSLYFITDKEEELKRTKTQRSQLGCYMVGLMGETSHKAIYHSLVMPKKLHT